MSQGDDRQGGADVLRNALFVILGAPLIASAQAAARTSPHWSIVGEPAGAPAGCSNAGAAAALDAFFNAMRTADSSALARTTATRRAEGFVFSTGKFTASDAFVAARTVRELVGYARRRATQHERIMVQEVTFNEWRGARLEFGPIYFQRAADDLGSSPLNGVGKGEYWCGQGISVLNTAPRPSFDRGPAETDPGAAAARDAVAKFYAWYVPVAASSPGADMRATRDSRWHFSPPLIVALRADSTAASQSTGEIVGLDMDPFLNAQDPCNRYAPVNVHRDGKNYFVDVRGAGGCTAHKTSDVTVRVAFTGAQAVFVNFLYSKKRGDNLMDLLADLAANRAIAKRPSPGPTRTVPAVADNIGARER